MYSLTPEGVKHGSKIISRSRLKVVARYETDGLITHIRLSVSTPAGKSKLMTVPMDELSKRGWTVELAKHGVDAGAHNHKELHAYVMQAAFDAPIKQCVVRVGWQGPESFYLTGDTELVSGDDAYPMPDVSDYADRYTKGGSLEYWLKAANKAMAGNPRVALVVYASVAAPLLRVLGASPFGLQWSGPSCTGKSTCLNLAASAWGDPAHGVNAWRESKPEKFTCLSDMPILLDDATLVSNSQAVAIANALLLLKQNQVLLCTGIEAVDEMAKSQTVRSRLLGIWGLPFGKQDKTTALLVVATGLATSKHYGHFGPEFIKRLIECKASWPAFKLRYERNVSEYAKALAEYGGMAAQAGKIIGTIVTVGSIVHTLFPELDTITQDQVGQDLMLMVKLSNKYKSRGIIARELVRGFYRGNTNRILGMRSTGLPRPENGYIGKRDADGTVWLSVAEVSAVLKAADLDPKAVIEDWRAAGMLRTSNGRATKRIFFGKTTVPCLSLLKSEG
jgi:hypothetical protein